MLAVTRWKAAGGPVFKRLRSALAPARTVHYYSAVYRSLGNRMFAVHDTAHTVELDALRSTALYDDFLDTPLGSWIAADLADAKKLRRVAKRAGETQSSSGDTGLNCQSSETVPTTVAAKLTVLNCLTLDSPHSFWVKGNGTRGADTLRDHDEDNAGKYRWLSTGDWGCTPVLIAPQGPVPSCLKHDVAYATLQVMDATPDPDELDTLWNPRNKALADERFWLDIVKHGCQDEDYPFWQLLYGPAVCEQENADIAFAYYGIVTTFNGKGPVTKSDMASINRSPSYVECSDPPVPMAQNVRPFRDAEGDFVIEFTHHGGCVDLPASKVLHVAQWGYSFSKSSYPARVELLTPIHPECELQGSLVTCTFDVPESVRIKGTLKIYAQPVSAELNNRLIGLRWRHYGGAGSTGRVVSMAVDLGF